MKWGVHILEKYGLSHIFRLSSRAGMASESLSICHFQCGQENSERKFNAEKDVPLSPDQAINLI